MVATNRRPARARFGRLVRLFFTSEVRRTAITLAVLLLVLLLGIAGLNVVNSYVGRGFMSALAERRPPDFYWFAAVYLGVFLASSAAAALERYVEERLALTARGWLTRRLVGGYLEDRAYLRLRARSEVQNPDQRIADDVREFTATVLSFCVLLFNGTVTAVSFSVVLGSISPTLLGVCVGYAVLGSAVTFFLGRPLIGLNYRQFDREADFRSALIRVRENATGIALARAEAPLLKRLAARFASVVVNFRTIIGVNLRLNFSTNVYNYLPQLIPVLVVGPLYMRGEVEFGAVTQSAMAFSQLIGALSLLVSQFQAISSFSAAVSRLGELAGAIEASHAPPAGGVETVEVPDRVAFERLTLVSPGRGRVLLRELTAAVGPGGRLLVAGPNAEGRSALFLAAAGLWTSGSGKVERPPPAEVQFVPQRPYVLPGTLRDQFFADPAAARDDGRVMAALEAAGLGELPEQAGGLDAESDWPNALGLAEQQRLALARVLLARPRFAFLDRVGTVLGTRATEELLGRLASAGVGFLTFADSNELAAAHDEVLELQAGGGWSLRPARAGRVPEEVAPGAV